MFFVTSVWRGSMHVHTMRIFSTEEAAWQYADTLNSATKVYELSDVNYPRLCKRPTKT